jgi:hypothetical protein
MFTKIFASTPISARFIRTADRSTRTACIAALALVLSACSGGSSGVGVNKSYSGTVIVRATSISGTPIVGATVSLTDYAQTQTVGTDANGNARFDDVIRGDASVFLSAPGYYTRDTEQFVVSADSVKNLPLTLVHRTEATPVLLAAHPVYPADGNKLSVDLDVALLDSNGAPWETLTTSDFRASPVCDWGCYFWDVDGSDLGFVYNAGVVDAAFVPAPITPRRAIAAGVLVDQGAEMRVWDPDALRLQAVGSYFDSIAAPDTVALGSFQGVPGTPALTTYGEFTSDAGGLHTAVAALAGQESGTNPLYTALADMISFTAANTAPGPVNLQRAIVVVTGDDYSHRDGGCDDVTCTQVRSAAEKAALANGIAIVAVGPSTFNYPYLPSVSRTGGAVALVNDPVQFPVVFSALNSILGHSTAYTRVRVVLDSGEPDAWIPGRVVPIFLYIRLAPGTSIGWYLELPI